MQFKRKIAGRLCLVSAICSTVFIGCSPQTDEPTAGPVASGPAGSFDVVVDTSASTNDIRPAQVGMLNDIIEQAVATQVPISLWSAHNGAPESLWPLRVPDDPKDLGQAEQLLIADATTEKSASRSCRPDVIFSRLQSELQVNSASMRRPFLLVLTNGNIDPQTDNLTWNRALEAIKSQTGYHVYIVGIQPGSDGPWDQALSRLGKSHYTLAMSTQEDQVMTEICGPGPNDN